MNKSLSAAIIAIALALPACGGARQAPPPDASIKALGYNQRAEDAFKRNEYEKASVYYREALRINRSIENIDGIAINLINLSAVYRKMADTASAGRQVDEILVSPLLDFPPVYRAEAAYIKAIVNLDAGLPDAASEWADMSLSMCQSAKCGIEGRVYNLKARIALALKDPALAMGFCATGLKINREAGNREEAANSLRLMAEARISSGEFADALKLYEEALSMDKSLGLSRKIAIDLMGAGKTLKKLGKDADAERYFKRAASVASASGDAEAEKTQTLIR